MFNFFNRSLLIKIITLAFIAQLSGALILLWSTQNSISSFSKEYINDHVSPIKNLVNSNLATALFTEDIGAVTEQVNEIYTSLNNLKYIILKDYDGYTLKTLGTNTINESSIKQLDKLNNTIEENIYHTSFDVTLSGEKVGYIYIGLDLSTQQTLQKNLNYSFILSSIITLIISALLIGLFVFLIIKNLQMLVTKANEIAHGNLDDEIKISSNDEIGKLVESFNEMQKQLKMLLDEKNKELIEKKKTSMVFENINEGVIITDKNGVIINVNKGFTNITGYSIEDSLGKEASILQSGIHTNPFYEKMWNTLLNDGFWSGHITNKMKDGTNYTSFLNISTLKDEDDNTINYIGVFTDITNIIEYEKELRKKDSILEQQKKLAALGEMMDAIAHQWKQPLNTISLNLDLLETNAMIQGKVHIKELEETNIKMKQQLDHLINTIDEFRSFFRPNQKLVKTNIKDLIDSTTKLMKTELIKDKVTINIESKEDIYIECLANELKHVFINLINNSIDAFNEKNIKDRNITFKIFRDLNITIIEVCDNAGGIPENIINNIFQSNFTTKDIDKGSGIGLYLSKQIIEKLGGKIYAKNTLNGVCFIIEI